MSHSTTTTPLGAPEIVRRRAAALGAGPAGATVAVVALCLVTLAVFNVPLAQSVPYLSYELGFVIAPGTLATLAITGARRLGLQELVLGIGVGYGIELLVFAATASTGHRSLFPWYPLVVAAMSLPFVRVRPMRMPTPGPGGAAWLLAAIMATLIGFLANSILDTPIPQHIWSLVGYPTDMLWSTAVTAEAMHHWPLTVPGFAGRVLHYHYFAYMHLAGAARVTGLSPWLLNFRFFPLWALLLAAFELYVFAKSLSSRRSAGLIAVFALLVASNFLPWPGPSQAILSETYLSVTFAFGLVVWIPMLMALRLAVLEENIGYRRGSAWLLVATLTLTASGAKAPIMIVAGAGLGLAAVVLSRTIRPLAARFAAATGIVVVVFSIAWFALYRTTNGSVTLKPFGALKGFQPFVLVSHHVPHALLWLLWLAVACIVTVKILAAMLPGIAAAVRLRPRFELVFLLTLVVAGFVLYFAFTNVGSSQDYFAMYAEVPAAALAGLGLAEAYARVIRPIRVAPGWIAVAVGAILVIWAVESPVDPTPKPAWENIPSSSKTGPEYVGFRWIATHTSPGAVLAVDARKHPSSCFQTAFAERRAMIDCYFGFAPEVSLQTVEDLRATLPASLFHEVEGRVALNDEIFDKAAPSALSTVYRDYGVRYVVVDLRTGGTAAQILRLSHAASPVFRNSAVAVFRISKQ